MSRIRTKVGRVLRESGLIAQIPDAFTATQLGQLRTVVAAEIQASASPRALEPERQNFLDSYTSAAPSPQVAVDIFSGEWSSRLPDELNVTSGDSGLFADPRIDTAIEWFGKGIVGADVLELGPLEGGHTFMLDRAGAKVYAVESNSRAYLKCLVAKELLGMKHARFVRGDFVEFLRTQHHRYDLVVASGVLYHMADPVELLTLMAAAGDRLAIWTHYYDGETLRHSSTARQFQTPPEPYQFGDARYLLHPRDYLEALAWGGFCGGPETYAHWMERHDILDCLGRLGFTDIQINHEQPMHPNGPSFLLLARR